MIDILQCRIFLDSISRRIQNIPSEILKYEKIERKVSWPCIGHALISTTTTVTHLEDVQSTEKFDEKSKIPKSICKKSANICMNLQRRRKIQKFYTNQLFAIYLLFLWNTCGELFSIYFISLVLIYSKCHLQHRIKWVNVIWEIQWKICLAYFRILCMFLTATFRSFWRIITLFVTFGLMNSRLSSNNATIFEMVRQLATKINLSALISR